MSKRFRVELLRDAYVRYETEVQADTEDEAWEIASGHSFSGKWQRGDTLEFDHTERGEIEEIDSKEALTTPTSTVLLTRMVEEVATIEVAAANVEEAVKEAEDKAATEWPSLPTEPGDWCETPEAYAAKDEAGKVVWER